MFYHYEGPLEVFATSKSQLTILDYFQFLIGKSLELLMQLLMKSKLMFVEGKNCDDVNLIDMLVSIVVPASQITTTTEVKKIPFRHLLVSKFMFDSMLQSRYSLIIQQQSTVSRDQ